MKTRNTFLLLLVCIGAFAYLRWYDSKQLSTDEKLEKEGKPVEVDRDDIQGVTIRNSEGTIVMKKREGGWFIESPVQDRAEDLALTTLFTSLETLNATRVPVAKDAKDALKEFGLTRGEASLKLEGKKAVEILLGKETAIEGKVYLRLDGADTAYVVSKGVRDNVTKGLKEWRSRKLSDVTASQVNKVVLKTAKGEIELEKKGLNWNFVRPFKARGDNQKIADLVSNAANARIEDFITDSKDLSAYGLNEPRATLTLSAEGVKEPVVLQLGSAKPGKVEGEKKEDPAAKPVPMLVYVKLSTRDSVVTVPAALESLITTQPNDLRDQNLVRVQSDIVDRIVIEAPGKEKIVLARKGEEWVRKLDGKTEMPANGSAANKLLNDLVTTKITRQVADMASDLKGFGLDQPQAAITLASYSTEGTPETKPGEQALAKVMLGRFEGDAGYAKLDDEPFIVSVPSSLISGIWTDPLQWQDLKVLDLKKDAITGLEIARTGQPTLSYTLDKQKGWMLAKGDGVVNASAAQSLVNTLVSLRAVRWLGATNAVAQGLDKPNLVLTFKLADGKAGKLSIGSNTPEEMWHATLEGKMGTFLVNKPDFDALNSALIETPKPAAANPVPTGALLTPPVATEPVKVPAAPKPTEAPSGPANPAPESAPKLL